MKYSQLRNWLPYIGYILCFTAISLAVVPVSSIGFELPKFAMAAVLALGACFLLILQKSLWPDLLLSSVPGILYLSFGGVTILSLLWSVAPAMSLLGTAPRFQGVLAVICFLILGIQTAMSSRTERGRHAVIVGVLTVNILVVLYGIMQMLHIDPLASVWLSDAFLGRVFSTLGHPNSLGQFILLTAPFVALYWLRNSERVHRMAWGSLLILNIALLLGTVSRSAILGMICMLILVLPSLKRWVKARVTQLTLGQAFALVLIIVLCSSIGLLFFTQRFALTFETGRSASARVVIWESVARMIADRPYGYGLETMAVVSPQYVGKELYAYESLTTTVDRAHNHVLHILYALGPLGMLIYISLACSILLLAWNRRSHDASGVVRAAAIGIVGFQVTLLFGFPSNATAPIFWMLTGFILGQTTHESRSVAPWIRHLLNILLMGIATVATVVGVQWLQSRAIVGHARMTEHAPLRLGLYQEAVLMFRYDRDVLIEAAEAHLFALEHVSEQRDDLIASTQTLIALLRSATGDHDGFAWLLEAWLSAIEGKKAAVESALQQAKHLLPSSIIYHRTGMHIAELLGDGVLHEEHSMGIRSLLPDGFFEEGSDMRRILLKKNPWLTSVSSTTL